MEFFYTVSINILSNIMTSFVWAVIIVAAVYFFISKVTENYEKAKEEIFRSLDEVMVIVKKSLDEYIKFFKQLAMSTVKKIMIENSKVRKIQCSVKISIEFKPVEKGNWENVINKDDISEEWTDDFTSVETIDDDWVSI